MPLSDDERARIREEEWVRLQAREDFKRTNPEYHDRASKLQQKAAAFGTVVVAALLALVFLVLKTH
jgi:hypothetical protein